MPSFPDILTGPDKMLLQFLHGSGYWKNARFFGKGEHAGIESWMSNDRGLDDETIYRILVFDSPSEVYSRKHRKRNRVAAKVIMPTDALAV